MKDAYPYDVINKSGEEAPGFAIMLLDPTENATENKKLLTGVTKPDGGHGTYVINTAVPLADDGKGKAAYPITPVWMKYEGDTPSAGDTVGPTEDSWYVSKDGDGFYVWRVDSTNGLVYASAGACPYYWQFVIVAGAPTSGSQTFTGVEIGSDTDDVEIQFDDAGSDIATTILGLFSELDSNEVEGEGGNMPDFIAKVKFTGNSARKAREAYLALTSSNVGTNTMNEGGKMRWDG